MLRRAAFNIGGILVLLSSCSSLGHPMIVDESNTVFSDEGALGERDVVDRLDLPKEDIVHTLAWSPNGNRLLITTNRGGVARIYDLNGKKLGQSISISDYGVAARGAIVYDDGSFIAPVSGVSTNKSSVVSTLTRFDYMGKRIRSIAPLSSEGDLSDVNILKLSSDGAGDILGINGVATTAKTRGLPPYDQWPAIVIDVKTGSIIFPSSDLLKDKSNIVKDVSIARNGSIAAFVGNDGQAYILSRQKRGFVSSFNICQPRSTACNASYISSGGSYLLTNSDIQTSSSQLHQEKAIGDNGSGGINLWSIKNGQMISVFRNERAIRAASLENATWRPDESEVAIADTATVSIWSKRDGSFMLTFNRTVKRSNDGKVNDSIGSVSYSNKGMLAIAAGNHVIIYK